MTRAAICSRFFWIGFTSALGTGSVVFLALIGFIAIITGRFP